MIKNEKRKSARIASLNLSYIQIGGKDEPEKHTMGRTLNVSECGILLETHFPVEINSDLLLSIGLGEEVVDIKGKVVHTAECKNDKYEMGVEFVDMDEITKKVLKKFINAFKQEQTNNKK